MDRHGVEAHALVTHVPWYCIDMHAGCPQGSDTVQTICGAKFSSTAAGRQGLRACAGGTQLLASTWQRQLWRVAARGSGGAQQLSQQGLDLPQLALQLAALRGARGGNSAPRRGQPAGEPRVDG